MLTLPFASGRLCPRCERSTLRHRVPFWVYLLPLTWLGLSSYRYCTTCDRGRLHLHRRQSRWRTAR